MLEYVIQPRGILLKSSIKVTAIRDGYGPYTLPQEPVIEANSVKVFVEYEGTYFVKLTADGWTLTYKIEVNDPTNDLPDQPVRSFNGRGGVVSLQESDLPGRLSPASLNAAYVPVGGAVPLDTTNSPLPLGVASPGVGTSGASPSDHVHAIPALTGLADVTSGLAPTAGQALVWDATAGKWKAESPASPLWASISSGEITLPRGHTDDSNSFGSNPVSGEMRLTYFRAQNTGTRGTVRFQTGGSAAASSTLARIGVYSVDPATGNLVALLASCTNKTTFSGTYTQQTCALTASVSLVAGTIYAVGILQVATTPASLAGAWFNGTFMGAGPKLARKLTGLSDLPAGPVTSGFADTQFPIYAELV